MFRRDRRFGFDHDALAALKSRTAGTRGESSAIRYVKENLRGIGVDNRIEPFRFASYDLKRAQLQVGDVSVQAAHVVFDPYRGVSEIKGEVAFVPRAPDRIVITTKAGAPPAAIVYVSDGDFARLKGAPAGRAVLRIEGRVATRTSANLVAMSRNGDAAHEIILSAHIDSAGTPGAQDNASGVAVLLELARTLPKLNLPFRLRFVFFGAEEVGLLGSRAYVDSHREDLRRCELLFNMDSVGGKETWIDMAGGVRNLPGPGQRPQGHPTQAGGDFTRWTCIGSGTMSTDASNVPPWLQTAILDTVRELGYPINQGQGAGSDHRTFSEAGVVATNIAIGGIKSHVPEDVPEQIDPASLERAARIVTGVVTPTTAAPRNRQAAGR